MDTAIAIDPGISTGVAIYTGAEYITLVIREPKDLWDVIDKHSPSTVIFENFASGGLISTEGQATLRLIGAIEVVCYIKHIPTVLQFPAERKPFLDKARSMLKQVGKPLVSHEVDALAHLLLFQWRVVQNRVPSARRQTWSRQT